MQLLNRAPTRHYFISIFIIVSVLFITFSAVIYSHYSRAQQLNEVTLYNYEIVRQSRRVQMSLLDMETGVRGYLLSGEKHFLEPYETSERALGEQLKSIRNYTKNDQVVQEDIDGWLERIGSFSTLLRSEIDNYRSKGRSEFSIKTLHEQKRQMDDLRDLLETSIKSRLETLQLQLNKTKDAKRNFQYILVIGTILAVGGLLTGTLVILSLIKRSEEAEEASRQIEGRFLTVMNGIDDGLYDFNLVDESLYFSPSYKAMLGYTDEEHPNTIEMVNSIMHPKDFEHVWETVRKYQAGEIPTYHSVFRLRHKDGSWVWILSRGVGLKDANGKMTRIIGTHTDITEHKEREEELRRLNKEMESFTYITSHDLRAPLVNLKGFSGEIQYAIDKIKPTILGAMTYLKEEDRDMVEQAFEEDLPESLRFIIQSVEKMDALTTAILDLSRIGKREYRLETVDTQTLIERCIDALGHEIGQKHIEVTYGHLPIVTSDPLALEQVFTNVLDNAVKYLDPTRAGKISVNAREMDDQFVFSVTDNGRGIAEEDRKKVFQIFRRARNTLNIRGQGMGMTFVQATLRKLGGSIWFDSEADVGTTFYVSLPKNVKKKGNEI